MKHTSEQTGSQLTHGLLRLLYLRRAVRNFDAVATVQAKAKRLNEYLSAHGLKSCVVAVSGGIDSAIVLGLVAAAAKQPGSPIERIVPVLLPVFDPNAATGQDSATSRGREVCQAFGLEPVVLDLTPVNEQLRGIVEQGVGLAGEGWARGQLVAYSRTPTYYYVTSLLSQAGLPGVVVGTTNMDEGAYLGYFGKASDGLVDVQLISDLHKSEVYAVARVLGVPQSVQKVVPTGDMYDGRVDEEVFGAPYDFVELYLDVLRNREDLLPQVAKLDLNARMQLLNLGKRLEELHRYNLHKYYGKSPAVHLDLRDAKVPGGWDYFVWTPSKA